MKHFVVVPVVVAALVATPSRLGAQSQDAQSAPADPVRFNTEIIVTPERGETPRSLVPASTVIVDSATLQAVPAAHLAEIISFVPGFQVEGAPLHAGRPVVSARGFFGGGEAEYILLLVDGVPVSDIESGLIDWSLVPTASIRRIEASRGPGASHYGDSAIGGVIQILTDKTAGGSEVNLAGGSFGLFSADAGYARRRDVVGVTLSGAVRRTRGAFEHSAGHQFAVNGSVDGRKDGFTWRWTANGEARTRDDPGALSRTAFLLDARQSDPMHRFDALDRRGISTALTVRRSRPRGGVQARINLSARDQNVIRTILLAPGVGDRQKRRLATASLGGSIEGQHAFAAVSSVLLRFGIDLSRERLATSYWSVTAEGMRGTLNGTIAGHRIRAGAFASASWNPSSRLRLTSALRWDDVDDTAFDAGRGVPRQRAWSPRAGIVLQLNDAGSVSLFSQVSRAFKAPTLDQRFDPRPYPDFRGGSFTISNAALVPQQAVNVEAGLSGTGPVNWSALAYRMTVQDEIDFDLRTFRYANIGRSRHVGLEVEAGGTLGNRLRPSVSYTLSRAVDADGGGQLKNIPAHRIGITIDADLPAAIGLLVRFSHSRGGYLDDNSEYPIDGPSAVNLRVRRPLGRHTLYVDVLNLTNDIYAEYGFTLNDFAGRAVPFVYPGAPRAVRAGVTLSF